MTSLLQPTPFLRQLHEYFRAHGLDIRFVGGCVRDSLLGVEPKDVDLCTDATVEEQIAIYRQHGVSYIETGLRHGTLTVIDRTDRERFEITSLRIDVETDGRHAVVAPTRDWREDALRRDFTINAMSLDFDGTLHDHFGGQDDLQQGRVVFVGDAAARIQEDYLRILRYFRFLGRFGGQTTADAQTLATIALHSKGLERISVERIWSEVAKIITAPSGREMHELMIQAGVTKVIGLQGAPKRVESGNPITQLVASQGEHALLLVDAWKMSSAEAALTRYLLANTRADILDYKRELAFMKKDPAFVRELAILRGERDVLAQLDGWPIPVFPVTGDDLLALGYKPGKVLGLTLSCLRLDWAASDYTADRKALLATVQQFVSPAIT